jgi:hypothetical protein
MTSTELLSEVRKITTTNLELLKKKFLHFSEDQKKWRSTDASWNLVEIFAHLNQYALFYHTAFRTRIGNTKFREFKENFVSSPLGRSAWSSIKLGNAKNVKRKFKAQRNYNPSIDSTLVTGTDIHDFIAYQNDLLEIIELSKTVNIRKAKVPIAISKIIRLRLGDVLLFVTYHNERHIQQAVNLIQHPRFPKK